MAKEKKANDRELPVEEDEKVTNRTINFGNMTWGERTKWATKALLGLKEIAPASLAIARFRTLSVPVNGIAYRPPRMRSSKYRSASSIAASTRARFATASSLSRFDHTATLSTPKIASMSFCAMYVPIIPKPRRPRP